MAHGPATCSVRTDDADHLVAPRLPFDPHGVGGPLEPLAAFGRLLGGENLYKAIGKV